jgi:hypothetical protein
MEQPRKVVAVFATPAASWDVRIAGGAGGTGKVVSSPSGLNCAITAGVAGGGGCLKTFTAGLTVTLTATAQSGSLLKSWAGAGCDTAGTGIGTRTGTCVVTVDQKLNLVVSFDNKASAATLGRFTAPLRWPAVGIHAHLLPDGRVMTWGLHDYPPVIWNPADGSFTTTDRPVDLFCSGHSFLPDGRLFVAGGHGGVNDKGIPSAQIFDWRTNTWTAAPDMRNGRWYPTNTTLPNGEVLVVAGGDTLKQPNTVPEVFQTDGTWRVLTGATLRLPYYPMMFVAPDGRVFAAGPNKMTGYLDPSGTGRWTKGPTSHYPVRDYGSAVMYDAGKILLLGGGGPTNSAEVIDLNAGASAAWRVVAPMSVARRQTTATLLANGQVLVTGGTNAGGFNTVPTSAAVMAAELWDPVTEQWTKMARMSHFRLYHSTALLLPDARVLVVGSGQPAATGLTSDYTAEIYLPPYLFQANGTLATRPSIVSAPAQVAYGQAFTVSTPNALAISKVTWIRLGSVTHSFDQNQRMNYLSFSAPDANTLTVTAPADARLSPPGHYLLFVVDSAGVPSVAKVVGVN